MHPGQALGALLLVFLAVTANSQQPPPEEFISVVGRFGVMLPSNYAEHKPYVALSIGNDNLSGALFRWVLDSDQAVVSYAVGSVDFETKAAVYLQALRDAYAQKTVQGTIIGEKKTSLAGHPGLIFVVENKTGRSMAWAYLVKNRVYLMSLTLNHSTQTEAHVKLMSTVRFLSLKDLEPRLTKLVDELTPEPLPQEPANARPTTDAQDVSLKGRVKTVITERERYFGEFLFGERDLVSVENYDQAGNLTRTVLYRASLPEAVRAYGTLKGERVFREVRKFPDIVLAGDRPKVDKAPKPEPKLFKLKYKYDRDGQLLELRVIREEGKELESSVYNPKAKTVERTFDVAYGLFAGTFEAEASKMVSTLDSNGHSIEDAFQVRDGQTYTSDFVGGQRIEGYKPRYKTEKIKHEYELDQHGNWIRQKTISMKDNRATSITYRTINYYE